MPVQVRNVAFVPAKAVIPNVPLRRRECGERSAGGEGQAIIKQEPVVCPLYGHAWANNLGEYLVTDSPGYNPNIASNLHWGPMTPTNWCQLPRHRRWWSDLIRRTDVEFFDGVMSQDGANVCCRRSPLGGGYRMGHARYRAYPSGSLLATYNNIPDITVTGLSIQPPRTRPAACMQYRRPPERVLL